MKSKFYALLCGLSLVLTCSMHGAEKTVKPKTALAASQAMTASTCTTTAAAAAVTSAESTLSPQQQRRYALTNAATKMFDARKKLQSLLSTDSEEGKALAEWIEGEQEYYSLIKTPVVDPMDATKKVLMEMGKRRLALDNSISHVHSSNDNQRTIKEEYLNLSAQLRTKRAMLFKQCNNTAEAAMKIELD